jgi:beta-lactamase regulating signal transducer with metallopeptidase domain
MSLLRVWMLATGGGFLLAMTWAFAPILVPLALVALGLWLVVIVIVAAARLLERHRAGARSSGGDGGSPEG